MTTASLDPDQLLQDETPDEPAQPGPEPGRDRPDGPPPPPPIARLDPVDPVQFGPVRRFLAYASGSVPGLLTQCPTDVPAQLGLGLVILSVGVIAALSMTYALGTALGAPMFVAVPMGILWGAIIFNLDRWLVASGRKMANVVWDLLALAPRLFLAIIIGIVISEPLVLRIFESAVEEQLAEDRAVEAGRAAERLVAAQRQVDRLNAQIAARRDERAPVPDELRAKRTEVTVLRAETDRAKQAYDAAELAITQEVEGLSATGIAGCGGACRVKLQNRDLARSEYERVRARNEERVRAIEAEVGELERVQRARDDEVVAANQPKIASLNLQIDAVSAAATQAHEGESTPRDAGLLERMRALHHLEGEDGGLRYAHWALAFMFIALDCLPVFGKFMNNRGAPRAYDMRLAAEEARVRAAVEERERQWRSDAEFQTRLLADESDLRRTLENENTEHFLRDVAAVQRDLASAVVSDWDRREKERLLEEQLDRARRDGGLSSYISWMRPSGRAGDVIDLG